MRKNCFICGKPMDVLTNREKYCSDKCSRHKKYYRPKPMLRKKCLECEKIFMTRRSNKKFCSIICKDTYHKIKTPYKKLCLECKEEFATGKTYQYYCCKSCYNFAKNRRSKKEYLERKVL